MSDDNPLRSLQLIFGQATHADALVYARLPRDEFHEHCRLAGTLVGPECRYAHTLPLTVLFHSRGAGNALLSEALLPDPCFWTPELPFVYRVEIQLVLPDKPPSTISRLLGIRRLGVRGRHLYYEGKRWVPRAITSDRPESLIGAELREIGACVVISHPSDQFCREMSLAGVLLLVEVRGNEEQISSELARLSHWPAVGIAILDPQEEVSLRIRHAAPNIVLAQRLPSEPTQLAPWARLAVVDASDGIHSLPPLEDLTVPIIVERRITATTTAHDARAACDTLQADLAPFRDFAGYIV